MKKLTMFLLTSFVIMMLISSIIEAKSHGSSRSFGGRSSSSSSSFKISGKSSSSSSSFNTSSSFGSSSKPSSPKASIEFTRNNTLSSLSKKGATGEQAGLLYKSFRSSNKPAIDSNKKLNTADIDRMFSPSYRQERRKNYYSGYTPTYSPRYREIVVQNHSNGYGIWDLLLFQSLLDNIGDREMYYHHMDDPDFKKWRADANTACNAGDTEICDKLKDLDKSVAEYKSKGTKQNPNYITAGIDPDIYEANNIDPKTLPELKICTGAIGSDYSRYASIIAAKTKLKVRSIPSNGSSDNIAKIASGECDLAFIQQDLLTGNNIVNILTLKQLEVGLLICPKVMNINTVTDLTKDITIFVGNDQTGSQFTLDRLRTSISKLAVPVVNTSYSAIEIPSKIEKTPNNCMFAVSTPDFSPFKQLDATNNFQAVVIDKDHFIDSTTKYRLVVVKETHYDNLVPESNRKWFKSGGIDTIGVPTSLVSSSAWKEQHKQVHDLLLLEQSKLQASLH
ncbi:MAG: hypothetical protein ACXW2E_01205 [Nitrososphaeraceae archaeon]